MKRAIGYARVSTLTQKKNETIEAQIEDLTAYAKTNGIELVEIYRDDGKSGADEDRVLSLVRFLQKRAQDFDVLLFTTWDRLSRDLFLQLFLEKELQKAGKSLLAALQENLAGDDPMTKAMRSMAGVWAELEKNMLVRKLANGRRHKALMRGMKASGNAPFGYAYDGKGTLETKIVVVPEQAEAVRRMFAWAIAGDSLGRICDNLAADGIPNARGKAWSRQAVAAILNNDFYTGNLTHQKQTVAGKHSAIITPSIFGKARAALARRSKRTTV